MYIIYLITIRNTTHNNNKFIYELDNWKQLFIEKELTMEFITIAFRLHLNIENVVHFGQF